MCVAINGQCGFIEEIETAQFINSVNMVSEAAATGKPVHVVHLEGGSKKFTRFHEALAARGITRPFAGTLEQWTYDPPDDMAVVVGEIQRRMAAMERA